MLKISDSCYRSMARLVAYHADCGRMNSTSELIRVGSKGGMYRLTLSVCARPTYGHQARVKTAELRAVSTYNEVCETNFDPETLNDYIKCYYHEKQ